MTRPAAGDHTLGDTKAQGVPASLGSWAAHLPHPLLQPVPIVPSRFLLRTGPQGTGPRCWPGGFWSDLQSPWYVFSSGTQLIVLGKRLSSPFPWVPPSAALGNTPLSVGCFPSALPAVRTVPGPWPVWLSCLGVSVLGTERFLVRGHFDVSLPHPRNPPKIHKNI